jgi:hypothetical protein
VADPAIWPPNTSTCCARSEEGQTRAVIAAGHPILVIVWHLMAHDRDYADLGGDHFTRATDAEFRQRYLVRQLEALGHKVTIEPAVA